MQYIFFTNWLGGHSPADSGYMTLSLVIKEDTMPMFNFVFKTLTPIVLYIFYIVICQSIPQLSSFGANSYLVIIYYWGWRWFYYSIHEIWRLVNWRALVLYVVVTVTLAILIYQFSAKVTSLLPSKEALRDQLWILIAIFVYQVINQLQIDREGTEERKRDYILKKSADFRRKYGAIISSKCETIVDEGLVYSIMIVENYNRPFLIRCAEYMLFFFCRKKMSLGIMQVKTSKFITEKESVDLGAKKIVALRQQYMQPEHYDALNEYEKRLAYLIDYVANEYNGGGNNYADEVEAIFRIVNEDIFPTLWDINCKEALLHKRK